MAKHFGEDEYHWKAIGYLHDYDYEKYPEEHLQHTAESLRMELADVVSICIEGMKPYAEAIGLLGSEA